MREEGATAETCARVSVTGRVQGVFFRAYTQRKANELGLTGWVRNTSDGRVEALFQGDKRAVESAVRWCKQGSPQARVERIDVSYETPTREYRGFNIRY